MKYQKKEGHFMKKIEYFAKKVIATALAGVLMISGSVTALAAAPEKEAIISSNYGSLSEDTAQKVAQEILHAEYDYDSEYTTDSIGSTTVKTALKFLKKNSAKITKILKKYGVTVAKGKGVSSIVDDILDGVIEVDDSVDSVVYAVVDNIIPNARENTKQVIANAIRLILPV